MPTPFHVRFSNANTTTDRYRFGGAPALPQTFRALAETRLVVDAGVPGVTPEAAEAAEVGEVADRAGAEELHEVARAAAPTTTRPRNCRL